MASLSKQEKDAFYDIIRKNHYKNINTIHYQCRLQGIYINRDKLAIYAEKLKQEDATSVRRSALERQHKIRNILSQIRVKESLLLKELNEINLKLNRTQQQA